MATQREREVFAGACTAWLYAGLISAFGSRRLLITSPACDVINDVFPYFFTFV